MNAATRQPGDDELQLTRRLFLQHTAAATTMTASLASIALKTDALAQVQPRISTDGTRGDGMPYPYT